MAATIHHEGRLEAAPGRVYQTLMQSDQHSAFTGGGPADISAEVGGAWSAFGGHIGGRNLELVPDKRIVQAWRAQDWPDGVYSIVRFELESADGATNLVF